MAVAARWDTLKSISTWAKRGVSNVPIAAGFTSSAKAPRVGLAPPRMLTETVAVKQLGEGWNWRELKIGDRFITYGRTLFEADLLNFVTLCGFSEELFTNKEYIQSHAPMRGGHPVPGALVYSMAEGLVIPTTLQGSGLAFLSMGFDIKRPTYVGDTIHVEIEVSEIKPTSKDAARALVRTTNTVKNQKGEIVLIYTPLRMLQGR